MRYGSVCSGIEAASVAWHPLGWRPSFFSEIEPFPCAVLAHHYPKVPLHGDFTTIEADQYATVDVLVGGTPCQSFSLAGLRGGLGDERGNLALEYLRLADRLRPRWLVWENVPGVLSSNGGRDFGSILGGLGELGYGWAYRVLDAQYVRVDGFGRAVPQRRRRVFVVGHLGDWRRAAAVLFERQSLSGHPAPRREARKNVAATLGQGAGSGGGRTTDLDNTTYVASNTAATLTRGAESAGKGGYAGRRQEDDTNIVAYTLNAKGGAGRIDSESETFLAEQVACDCADSQTVGANQTTGFVGDVVAHALRADGFDASEDGTGRGTPLVPVCFDETQITSKDNRCNPQPGDPCHPLASGARAPAIAFDARQSDVIQYGEKTGPLDTDGTTMGIFAGWRVRRLTPTECLRLQGFPDDYLDILYRGKPAADGPKYKACGNSMAVNVMRWIGQRIDMVESLTEGLAA